MLEDASVISSSLQVTSISFLLFELAVFLFAPYNFVWLLLCIFTIRSKVLKKILAQMKPQSSLSLISMRQGSKQCHFVPCTEVVQEQRTAPLEQGWQNVVLCVASSSGAITTELLLRQIHHCFLQFLSPASI